MPAVLVESAFITNPAEEQRLRQDAYRQRLAEALGDGIRAFLERYIRRVGVAGVSAAPGS
jgi:N-acetylmuramoyl-L-alanine amidase